MVKLNQLSVPKETQPYIDTFTVSVDGGKSFGGDRGMLLKQAEIRLTRRGGCQDGVREFKKDRTGSRVCANGDDGGYRVCLGKQSRGLFNA